MPSFSNLERSAIAAVLPLLVVSCVQPAPHLPPDTTSVNRTQSTTLTDFSPADAALTCDQIGAERNQISEDKRKAHEAVESNRIRNQAWGYAVAVGAGAPFLLATKSNSEDKTKIIDAYQREDMLRKLATVKGCPAT